MINSCSFYTEKVNNRLRNGIAFMENAQAMKYTISFSVIVDFLENMKEKALHMLVFTHTESKHIFDHDMSYIYLKCLL